MINGSFPIPLNTRHYILLLKKSLLQLAMVRFTCSRISGIQCYYKKIHVILSICPLFKKKSCLLFLKNRDFIINFNTEAMFTNTVINIKLNVNFPHLVFSWSRLKLYLPIPELTVSYESLSLWYTKLFYASWEMSCIYQHKN